jgi:hypothetical protein
MSVFVDYSGSIRSYRQGDAFDTTVQILQHESQSARYRSQLLLLWSCVRRCGGRPVHRSHPLRCRDTTTNLAIRIPLVMDAASSEPHTSNHYHKLQFGLDALSRGQWLVFRRNNDIAAQSRTEFYDRMHEYSSSTVLKWLASVKEVVEADSSDEGDSCRKARTGHNDTDIRTMSAVEALVCNQSHRDESTRPLTLDVVLGLPALSSCLDMLATKNATQLRPVSSACRDAVRAHPWDDGYNRITNMQLWLACFPFAKTACIDLSSMVLGDFLRLASVRHLSMGYDGETNSSFSFTERELCIGFSCLKALQSLQLPSWLTITPACFHNLSGIHTLNITNCASLTDDAFEYLPGIKLLDISGCDNIRGSGFKHFRGIHTLCAGPNISDSALSHLRGIYSLDVSYCVGITDAGLVYLDGINTLYVRGCTQLTGATFSHLRGIEQLYMCCCAMVTDSALRHIVGVRCLEIQACTGLTAVGMVYILGTGQQQCGVDSLTDAAATPQAHTPTAPVRLEELNVGDCSVSLIFAALRFALQQFDTRKSLLNSLIDSVGRRTLSAPTDILQQITSIFSHMPHRHSEDIAKDIDTCCSVLHWLLKSASATVISDLRACGLAKALVSVFRTHGGRTTMHSLIDTMCVLAGKCQLEDDFIRAGVFHELVDFLSNPGHVDLLQAPARLLNILMCKPDAVSEFAHAGGLEALMRCH